MVPALATRILDRPAVIVQVIQASACDSWEAFSQQQSATAEANQSGAHVGDAYVAKGAEPAAGAGARYLQRLPQLTRRLGSVVREAVVASSMDAAESPLLGGEYRISQLRQYKT